MLVVLLFNFSFLDDILSQMKLLSVIEPEQHEFVGGPAMFGPRLGGKSNYQVTILRL